MKTSSYVSRDQACSIQPPSGALATQEMITGWQIREGERRRVSRRRPRHPGRGSAARPGLRCAARSWSASAKGRPRDEGARIDPSSGGRPERCSAVTRTHGSSGPALGRQRARLERACRCPPAGGAPGASVSCGASSPAFFRASLPSPTVRNSCLRPSCAARPTRIARLVASSHRRNM